MKKMNNAVKETVCPWSIDSNVNRLRLAHSSKTLSGDLVTARTETGLGAVTPY